MRKGGGGWGDAIIQYIVISLIDGESSADLRQGK